MHCCHADDYAGLFDHQKAMEDLNDYRDHGVKKSSQPLFDVLEKIPVKDLTLLDVGGGIGAVIFEMFKRGIRYAVLNDISAAYVTQFRNESLRQNVARKSTSQIGDFTSVHKDIEDADLVTLDKVICCYSDYRSLVQLSSSKARKWYAINLPRNTWWVYALLRLDYYWQKLTIGKAFLTYFHPIHKIESLLLEAGFHKVRERKQNEWVAILFQRRANHQVF